MTQAEANRYLPPSAQISRQKEWHDRWRIKAPYLTEKSKVFKLGDLDDERKALLFCLRLVWSAYTSQFDETCPFDLGS